MTDGRSSEDTSATQRHKCAKSDSIKMNLGKAAK